MLAIWMRVRVWTRRNRVRVLVAGAVIGVLGGVATGFVAGAVRTASAPDRYTAAFGGDPDLVVTQQRGPSLTNAIASSPEVESVQSIAFVTAFLVAPTDGSLVFEPNPFAGDAQKVGTRVVEGRFPDPVNPNEFVVNRQLWDVLRRSFGTHVGDVFTVRSFDQQQVDANFDAGMVPAGPTFTATLVGVTEAPTEFDDPSQQLIFSPAFLDAHPEVGVVQRLMAVTLRDGADASTFMDAVRQLHGGEDAYAVPTRIVSASARRAVRFQVSGLWFVAVLSSLAAAAVIAQIVARTFRVADAERQAMLALGWRHLDFAAERGLEGLGAALIAAPIAMLVTFAVTGFFPIGALRLFEPDLGRRMDWSVTLIGVGLWSAAIVGIATVIGYRHPRRPATKAPTDSAGVVIASHSVPLAVGSRFATSNVRGRRSWASLLGGGLIVGGIVGSLIVGMSLTHVVRHPARWGVEYQYLFGNPYIDAPSDIITPIAANADVEAVTGVNIGSVTIDGSDTATVGFDQAKGGIGPVVIDGRLPLVPGEIGLGTEVERRIGAHIGDTVQVAGTEGGPQPFTVVGTVVTPDSAGNGAAMLFTSFVALNPTATENVALVDFRDGAPPSAIKEIADTAYSPPDSLVTPSSVRALERVTSAPYLLAIVLAILALTGCAYLLTTSVNARRRDFAILRALGSDRRQLSAIVHWQATIVGLIVLVCGVPLGIIAGRSIVTLLTDALGIVPGSTVSVVVICGVAAAVLVGANALALLLARRAASTQATGLALDRS